MASQLGIVTNSRYLKRKRRPSIDDMLASGALQGLLAAQQRKSEIAREDAYRGEQLGIEKERLGIAQRGQELNEKRFGLEQDRFGLSKKRLAQNEKFGRKSQNLAEKRFEFQKASDARATGVNALGLGLKALDMDFGKFTGGLAKIGAKLGIGSGSSTPTPRVSVPSGAAATPSKAPGFFSNPGMWKGAAAGGMFGYGLTNLFMPKASGTKKLLGGLAGLGIGSFLGSNSFGGFKL